MVTGEQRPFTTKEPASSLTNVISLQANQIETMREVVGRITEFLDI